MSHDFLLEKPGVIARVVYHKRTAKAGAEGDLRIFPQSNLESTPFFGKNYAASSPVEFAATFVDDLFGGRVSTINKTLILDFIANQMAAGATQTELISELTSAFSSVPSADPNWGVAALHYNTCNATKIIDYLLARTFTQADKAIVADHIVTQMAAGLSVP